MEEEIFWEYMSSERGLENLRAMAVQRARFSVADAWGPVGVHVDRDSKTLTRAPQEFTYF
jgi:hypothetical protein